MAVTIGDGGALLSGVGVLVHVDAKVELALVQADVGQHVAEDLMLLVKHDLRETFSTTQRMKQERKKVWA